MSEFEPIYFRPRGAGGPACSISNSAAARDRSGVIVFNRRELCEILAVYGRRVADGEWRDYALDMTGDKAVFSIFRRSSEYPLFRIEKSPKMARRQGAYCIVAATGLILKRGQDLRRVLSVLDKKPYLVEC